MRQLTPDRFGIGWRAPLAAQVFSCLDHIDVIEVTAEDYWQAGSRALRSMKSLGAHRPLLVHGVSLGLASTGVVEARRLDRLARLIGALEPVGWSEHLAFVRGCGHEIGHLAAPPRNARTLEGAADNLRRVHRVIGSLPALENVATLIEPPDSDLSEAAWVGGVLAASGGTGLLDLHNLYANAVNSGLDPLCSLRQFPLTRVRVVHLGGGRVIEQEDPRTGRRLRRVLDDHLHDVPAVVFEMLEHVGAHCGQPLDVVLERDGHFPRVETLLRELDEARAALAAGRRAVARTRHSA